MKLRLESKIELTPDVTTFTFIPEKPIIWRPGQYMHYVLPHENPDDRGIERWFTISSAPTDKHISITTRTSGEKGSSFKRALFSLPLGAEIEADGPEGDFIIDDLAAPVVFIAGGIGITPFHSILRELDIRRTSINGVLLYANRDNSVVFQKELDGIDEKYPTFDIKYVMSPDRIDEEYIRTTVSDITKPIFYLSGPEPMVKALEQILLTMKVPKEHIKLDDFPGYE